MQVQGHRYCRADTVEPGDLSQGIHPGYGFLSENAACAEAVANAGLTWIGPAAESIRLMGNKSAARSAVAGAAHREPRRVDPVDLPHPDADRGLAVGEQDGVGLHRATGPPGEDEVGEPLDPGPQGRRAIRVAGLVRLDHLDLLAHGHRPEADQRASASGGRRARDRRAPPGASR